MVAFNSLVDGYEVFEDGETVMLTVEEKIVCDNMPSFDELYHTKILPHLSLSERKPWACVDKFGGSVVKFKTHTEAMECCIDKNKRAESIGIKMSYRVVRSDEWYKGAE